MTGVTGAARGWHRVTFVIVVVALALQISLVAAGQNVIDDTVITASLPERLRRLFCYFTIQSNILVAVAVFMILRERTGSRFFRVVRLTSLVGITVTGVVAAVALQPSASYTAANLLCDRLLHIGVPLLAIIGWTAFGPRGHARRQDLLLALIWPTLWLAATLALGPVVGWYPYPFIDASRIGYGATLLNCALIAVLFLALAALAVWVDKRLPSRTARPTKRLPSGGG